MKRLMIILLIFIFVLNGCSFLDELQGKKEETVVEEETPSDPEEVKKEEPEEDTQAKVEEKKKEKEDPAPEVEEPEQQFTITAKRTGERYLNAFIDIDESEKNLSYFEEPIVKGPEDLSGFIKQTMDENFYKTAKEFWDKINKAQDEKKEEDEWAHFSVYRVNTSVVDDKNTIVVLGRQTSVYGYDMFSRDSKLFMIDKKTGDFVKPKDQLLPYGKTMEEALEFLRNFQSKYSAAELDDETKAKLMSRDLETQEKLTEEHGMDKRLILNNFNQPESYDDTEVFVVKEGEKEYYVTKLFFAYLGMALNDDFLSEGWVKIPVEDETGNLTLEPDPTGLVDYIYK